MSKLENYFGRQRSGPPIWLAVVLVSAFALAAFSHILNSTPPGREIVQGQTDPERTALVETWEALATEQAIADDAGQPAATRTAAAGIVDSATAVAGTAYDAASSSDRTITATVRSGIIKDHTDGLTATAADKTATPAVVETALALQTAIAADKTATAESADLTATANAGLSDADKTATAESADDLTATANAGLSDADKTATAESADLTATANAELSDAYMVLTQWAAETQTAIDLTVQDALDLTIEAGGGATSTAFTVGSVSRVEPAISSVTLRGGDSVRLAVDLYGAQDVLDNTLSQDVAITWSDGGAGGDFDTTAGRLVVYTAPSSPGTHTVTASVNGSCSGDCSTEFSITVRRASASPPEADDPVNPSGEIPGVLTDSGGTAYAVFAPVEGGRFSGEGFGVSAQAGAVPDGEIIGINMSEEGGASNIGATHQRYTLMGSAYSIEVIDSAGAEVSAYRLDTYAEACVPLPDALRANISDVSLVAINDDGTLTILTSNVKIAADGSLDVCGRVSSLPATVAAGSEGAPSDFPTPTPTPEIEEPDTGGTSPAPLALFLMLVLGAMLVSAPLVLRRRWVARSVVR